MFTHGRPARRRMIARIAGLACLAGAVGLAAAVRPSQAARTKGARAGANHARIDIIYTSDIHGHIDQQAATFMNPQFPPMLGGGASAATYIKHVRAEAEAAGRGFLLLDSGDLFQGTPIGVHFEGKAVIEWMNSMGYTSATLGNHDFDLGWERTRGLVETARFPILAANVFDTRTNQPVDWLKDMVMVEAAGVKVAIIGLITEETVRMSFARNLEGLAFKPVEEMLPELVRKARSQGAQIVLLPVHAGLPYKPTMQQHYREMIAAEARGEFPHPYEAMDLAHYFTGVDFMFAGHSHQGYDTPWEDPVTHTVVLEPYGNGSSVGHITITYDREAKTVLGYETHQDRGALITLFEDEFWPDQGVAEVIGEQVAEAEKGLDEVIGETRVNLQRSDPEKGLLGGLVADAIREFVRADVAIQNTGGVRADLAPGEITRRNTLAVLPFGNQMVVATVKGEFLKRLLEQKVGPYGPSLFVSGVTLEFDPTRPPGERILSFKVGDAPLELEREYKLGLTNYLAEGNSGMTLMREVPPDGLLYTGTTDREALEQYIKDHTPLNPKSIARWARITS